MTTTQLRYKLFGRQTGLRVSEFALGAGNFGTGWGHGAEPDEARRMFDRFTGTGGNFIDCSDGYQFGQAETLLGDFIGGDRDNFVVATKYTLGGALNLGVSRTGNSRKNMVHSVEESLKRLRSDRIDLYWVHMPDQMTPIEEIMRGLDDLVASGKVLYIGLSDFPAWRVARGATIAELRGWAPLVGLQLEYSLVERTPDRELLPLAEAFGFGTTLWSPLGGGFLSGKYRLGEEGRQQKLGVLVHGETDTQKTAVLDTVLAIAKEVGATPSQIAVAWLRAKAATSRTALIPILGPRTKAQLDDVLGALNVALSAEQLQRLNDVSAVPLGFPHQMAATDRTRNRVTGGQADLVDPPYLPVL
ncbi:MAG TPA: aldo/keto reductase [Dongiaceae bacterium]|nr:aldo/keto reductase [Dongiaceae bacterium]